MGDVLSPPRSDLAEKSSDEAQAPFWPAPSELYKLLKIMAVRTVRGFMA
jgi:hypothetical protein